MERRLATVAAVAATLLAGLWVTGCGDTGVRTPSTADFVAKGNAICKQTLQNLKATASQTSGDRPSPAESKRRFLAAVQDEIDRLHLLGAPAGQEARVSAMLTLAQKGLDQAKGDPSRLFKPGNPFTASRRKAYLMGLTSCAFLF